MEAKITPGAAQDVEKWSKNFSGGPPAGTSELFFAPGGLQERSGADFYSVLVATWGPGDPRRPPGAHLVHFGSHLAPFWALRLVVVGAVLASVFGPPGGEKQQLKQQKKQRKQQTFNPWIKRPSRPESLNLLF